MKTLKKYSVLVSVLIITAALLSWSISNNQKDYTPLKSFLYNKGFHGFTDAQLGAYTADEEWNFSPGSGSRYPAAEDVLIQRIPGDNNHLLLIAFYSKENHSELSLTVNNNGTALVFKDDGKGYDKKAGDGLYTTKINADVNDFRNNVIRMSNEMKQNGYKPYRFVNRSIVYNADGAENFDANKFDRGEAVSISGIEGVTANQLIQALLEHSIFITDLEVVEDPSRTWDPCMQTGNIDGPWTFKTLFKNLASADTAHIATDAQVSDFVKSWLGTWITDKIINGDTVKARTLVKNKILTPWLNKSKAAGSPQGQLDMKFAPFKLTAILNRFDIRERDFAQGLNAGEARFIFCLINSDCTDKEDFTVILEYRSPVVNDCDSIRVWAQRWFDLKDFAVGSPGYNQKLNEITDKFTPVGSNLQGPNQSALNAIRTNDRALSPAPTRTEFREFVLNGTTHKLAVHTIALTPADKFNAQVDNSDVQLMVGWVNANRAAIKKDDYTLPLFLVDSTTLDTIPFQAGKTTILDTPVGNVPNEYHWDGIEVRNTKSFIRNTASRHTFSLNICSGCHAGETQTFFFHVTPVFFGTETTLSGFLSGNPQPESIPFDVDGKPTNDSMMVQDAAARPQGNPLVYFFNDNLRRARDLKDFIATPCSSPFQIRDQLMNPTIHQPH